MFKVAIHKCYNGPLIIFGCVFMVTGVCVWAWDSSLLQECERRWCWLFWDFMLYFLMAAGQVPTVCETDSFMNHDNISVLVLVLDGGKRKTPVTLSALHTVYRWVRLMTAPTRDRNSGGPDILNSYITVCNIASFPFSMLTQQATKQNTLFASITLWNCFY